MAIDAVVSLGVVISGIVILYSGWMLIDPIISVVIAIVIIVSTWGLFRESLRLTADAVPEGIDHDSVRKAITSVSGVTGVTSYTYLGNKHYCQLSDSACGHLTANKT
jgi:cobalt-zinc-cadmium efflux system protein